MSAITNFEIVLSDDTGETESLLDLLEAAMPGEVECFDVLRITVASDNAHKLVSDVLNRLACQRNTARMPAYSMSMDGGIS